MPMGEQTSKWPKQVSCLTAEQTRIADDWMRHWLEINRNEYSNIIDFGHRFVVQHSRPDFTRTLEIGAGLGDHLDYEQLTDAQMENYVCLELRENVAEILRRRWPKTKAAIGD